MGLFVPLLILVLAGLAAGVVAYGTHPAWAQFPNGLEFILLSRRLQWPLVALSLLLCITLIGLIIAGRRRAWWLIGLGPVLALFVHRFVTDPKGGLLVVESPRFVRADEASFLAEDDYVVGLKFGDATYAYPYSVLYRAPVIIQDEHDKRMMLMWSAFANRALAVGVSRDIRARDVEVVCTPANALLLYDRRGGRFINGLTGLTPANEKPAGFGAALQVHKMTWKQWRAGHKETSVMDPAGYVRPGAPTRPILPSQPMPAAYTAIPVNSHVALVGAGVPVAVAPGRVGREPLNLGDGDAAVLVFREEHGTPIVAFERRLEGLTPRFELNRDRRRPKARFVDRDTNIGWDARGVAVDVPAAYAAYRLHHLKPLPVEDGLYWRVISYWYPTLRLQPADPATTGAVQ